MRRHTTHHATTLTRQLARGDALARESSQVVFSNVHRLRGLRSGVADRYSTLRPGLVKPDVVSDAS